MVWLALHLNLTKTADKRATSVRFGMNNKMGEKSILRNEGLLFIGLHIYYNKQDMF